MIYKCKTGLDFLGYVHFPTHILLRKTTRNRIKRKVRKLEYQRKCGTLDVEYLKSYIPSIKG
jgi:hypothetical protein